MPESFDEAFPGGVEECTRRLGQEPSIDDPEALCGWLQEHGFEAIADADPDSILAGLDVEFVSVVDEPAQDSEWLLAKSADADANEWTPGEDKLNSAPVLLKQGNDDEADGDDPERKVFAAVLKPGEEDAHGDLPPEPEIESAAHAWMKESRKMDSDHDLLDGEGVPIESYIVRGDPDGFTTPDGNTREYPEGTWILGAELSEEAWKRVENGELTGFSIYGGATRINPDALRTEEQKQANEILKAVNLDDLADAVAAFEADTGDDLSEATLVEFLTWVEANPNYDETDDENVADGTHDSNSNSNSDDEDDEDDEDEEEGSMSKDDAVAEQARETLTVLQKHMGDANSDDGTEDGQNEISDTLDEIRDLAKETNETVQKHADRLESLRGDYDELRDELDEVRKAVGLVDGDDSGDEGDEAGEQTTAGEGDPDPDGGDADGEAAKAVADLRDDLEKAGLLNDDEDGDGHDEDVTRKAQKNANVEGGGEENVEKSDDDDLNVTFEGITEATGD
jgi:hypothetical protein